MNINDLVGVQATTSSSDNQPYALKYGGPRNTEWHRTHYFTDGWGWSFNGRKILDGDLYKRNIKPRDFPKLAKEEQDRIGDEVSKEQEELRKILASNWEKSNWSCIEMPIIGDGK